jgi:arylsulfatase
MEGTSLAYAIDAPDEPTRKRSQYFEIFGHRGIWSDGWKAVVAHQAGTPFDEDPWELYHLDADFSEAVDLAAAEPARLQALVELWWAEAGRYDVLPLDDRQLERFHALRPHPITERRRFEYLSGVYVPGQAAPNIRNVSYSATARITAPGEGVLWSWGERFSGITMFVKDGRIVLDHNTAGDHYVLSAPLDAAFVGEVQFAFERTGELRGTGRLLVGGAVVDEIALRTHGTSVHAVGVSVGLDRCVAVSPEYRAPFPFTGTIHRVVFEVGDDRVPVTPASFFD